MFFSMSNPSPTIYSQVKQDFEEMMKSPKLRYYDNIVLNYINGIFVPSNCDKRIHPFKSSNIQTSLLLYGDGVKTILDEHTLVIDGCSLSPNQIGIDVCIGVNDDWSRPSNFVVGLVEEGFRRHGYKVRVDELCPEPLSPLIDIRYSSVMIAVNKHQYINGRTIDEKDETSKLKQTLGEIYSVLLSHAELI